MAKKNAAATVSKTAIQALETVKKSAEKMHSAKTERIGSPSLGDVVRQGDVYLVCIDRLPEGKETKDRQLAPGNTQGSRHIMEGDVTMVTGVRFKDFNSALVGPAFKCNSDATVTHPEHGNKVLPQDTVWQVVYQQAFAEEIRRVQD